MPQSGARRIGPQTHLPGAAVCPRAYAREQTIPRRRRATITVMSMT
jgi:hypothetical protein